MDFPLLRLKRTFISHLTQVTEHITVTSTVDIVLLDIPIIVGIDPFGMFEHYRIEVARFMPGTDTATHHVELFIVDVVKQPGCRYK